MSDSSSHSSLAFKISSRTKALRLSARSGLQRGPLRRLSRRVYFEDLVESTGNFAEVRWRGQPIWQNVLDLWVIQEVISELRPELLLETGTNRGGSSLFYGDVFELLGTD